MPLGYLSLSFSVSGESQTAKDPTCKTFFPLEISVSYSPHFVSWNKCSLIFPPASQGICNTKFWRVHLDRKYCGDNKCWKVFGTKKFRSGFSSLVNPHHLFQSFKLRQIGDNLPLPDSRAAQIRAPLGQEGAALGQARFYLTEIWMSAVQTCSGDLFSVRRRGDARAWCVFALGWEELFL